MSESYAFPEPEPLRRAALLTYRWGDQEFEVICTACSFRTTLWPETGEEVTWLHCKAMRTAEINPNGPTRLMNVLIPAHYVTGVRAGPAFRAREPGRGRGLGIFPPNQPTPADRLPLEEIEAAFEDLWDFGMN